MPQYQVTVIDMVTNKLTKTFEADSVDDATAQAEANGWDINDGWETTTLASNSSIEGVEEVEPEPPNPDPSTPVTLTGYVVTVQLFLAVDSQREACDWTQWLFTENKPADLIDWGYLYNEGVFVGPQGVEYDPNTYEEGEFLK